MDYAYTIMGWLKGINATTLVRENDMGKDGLADELATYTGLHKDVARDVIGFTLNYFEGEYSSVGSSTFLAATAGSTVGTESANLYNGNIRMMTTAIAGYDIQATSYTYDQLQRLKKMEVYRGINVTGNTLPGATYTPDYLTEISYDPNGNITSLNRNGIGSELDMDRFTYNYYNADPAVHNNQLKNVSDLGTDYVSYTDVKTGMPTTNYTYDAIGRLTSDADENIASITWRTDNKVSSINRAAIDGTSVEFVYNPMGMRVAKIAKPDPADAGTWVYTYYSYDAGGNLMAVYESALTAPGKVTKLKEQYLYSGSRAGVYHSNKLLFDGTLVYELANPTIHYWKGDKTYELTNHLGNVLATVSDRVTYLGEQTGPTDDDYGFMAYVQSKSDFYPFGMQMPERNESSGAYRYGFQGHEMDDEIKGEGNSVNYKYRMHDPRIGRFFAVDPLASSFPHNAPYNFSENIVIHGIELEGREVTYTEEPGNNGYTIITMHTNINVRNFSSASNEQIMQYSEAVANNIEKDFSKKDSVQ